MSKIIMKLSSGKVKELSELATIALPDIVGHLSKNFTPNLLLKIELEKCVREWGVKIR